MSTKSYTLADGTTATVDAGENGVPFNEGMGVLTKAIKAKISGPKVPTLTISDAFSDEYGGALGRVTYSGDGELNLISGNCYLDGDKIRQKNLANTKYDYVLYVVKTGDNYASTVVTCRNYGSIVSITASENPVSVPADSAKEITLTIVTDPEDWGYQLQIVNNTEWMTLVGNKITFAPDISVTPGSYTVTVVARPYGIDNTGSTLTIPVTVTKAIA